MPIHRRSLRSILRGAVLIAALVAVPSPALGHDDPCHADRTCPSDVTPPDYACGDNASATCSAPNSPDAARSNAAPPLGGPPSAADCRSNEIFYSGSICKQVLGVTSPTADGSPSAAPPASPTSDGTLTPVPTVPALTSLPAIGERPLRRRLVAVWSFMLAASVFMVAATWRVFTKAREPGWASLVPVYSSVVYLKIAGRPWWWILLLWLVVPVFIVNSDLAKAFGRSSRFGVGLTLLPFVFLPILAFGPARYRRGEPAAPRMLAF